MTPCKIESKNIIRQSENVAEMSKVVNTCFLSNIIYLHQEFTVLYSLLLYFRRR
jgi:hypothetical protein